MKSYISSNYVIYLALCSVENSCHLSLNFRFRLTWLGRPIESDGTHRYFCPQLVMLIYACISNDHSFFSKRHPNGFAIFGRCRQIPTLIGKSISLHISCPRTQLWQKKKVVERYNFSQHSETPKINLSFLLWCVLFFDR